MIALLLWACTSTPPTSPTPPEPAPVVEEAIPEGARLVPTAVLPHCMHGLDPLAAAVTRHPEGGMAIANRFGPLTLVSLQGLAGKRVLSVNGHAIDSLGDWAKAWTAVEGAKVCRYQVRGGAEVVVGRVEHAGGERLDLLVAASNPYVAGDGALVTAAGLPKRFLGTEGRNELLAAVETLITTDTPEVTLEKVQSQVIRATGAPVKLP